MQRLKRNLVFEIHWTDNSIKCLNSLEPFIAKRIGKKIEELSLNPFDKNIKKLVGMPYYRLRIGDYRVIFDVQKNQMIILIIKIGHRKNIY